MTFLLVILDNESIALPLIFKSEELLLWPLEFHLKLSGLIVVASVVALLREPSRSLHVRQ